MLCERMYVSRTESFIQVFSSQNIWEGRAAPVGVEAEILRSSMRFERKLHGGHKM